ncbi:MAG TPA: cytochrome c biogenesis protein DipZ [Terriglobales bacterium]|jgi:cytochrome c biogenesis protein CcdA|nr:cytochrome c biogenesis protein DipZ [Terriglobales bacterium]
MLIYLLAFVGGVLTILSPCILPVLPFVFARADQPFRRSGLPLLAGMALTFSLVAIAAAFGGHWVVRLNQSGRYVAMVIFLVLGITLLFPSLAEALTRPLVQAGGRLQGNTPTEGSVGKSFVLGISTGLLWAPCAGPILGLILTGAAIQGPGTKSSFLLLSFALGAATSLGLALLAGNKVFSALKKSLTYEVWIRRGLGVAVILGVVAIALGWDTNLLTKFSFVNTSKAEAHLIEALHAEKSKVVNASESQPKLADEGAMPELEGATAWLNSPPLSKKSLRGKVVLIDFWTYSCINCLRALPYVESWAAKYKDAGLVVIGVHTPEFAFEKDRSNVEKAVKDLKVNYPVAIDSSYNIWQAFDNQYWPAHYFVDGKGRVRYHHFGEGEYDVSERVIQKLLKENGATSLAAEGVDTAANGAMAAPDQQNIKSSETYVGYRRAANFASAEPIAQDAVKAYTARPRLTLNQWALNGKWKVGPENAQLEAASGTITFRFHARDLHLVLGPSKDGKPIRFKVKLDGTAPGDDHGVDTDTSGAGTVQGNRLYQLIRQKGTVEDRTFEIEFLDPGVQAFAFTFG